MTIERIKGEGNSAKPRITLSADDYGRLSALADSASSRMPDGAADLAEELGRARVLAKGSIPEHVVCMNSEVEFRDHTSGKVQIVTLVYPGAADISLSKVSVLTPVGTALIGLRSGHSITWKTPAGQERRLTVLSVREPRTTSRPSALADEQ